MDPNTYAPPSENPLKPDLEMDPVLAQYDFDRKKDAVRWPQISGAYFLFVQGVIALIGLIIGTGGNIFGVLIDLGISIGIITTKNRPLVNFAAIRAGFLLILSVPVAINSDPFGGIGLAIYAVGLLLLFVKQPGKTRAIIGIILASLVLLVSILGIVIILTIGPEPF